MQIVLYFVEPTSIVSKFVKFITSSEITHASIINKGIEYDTDLIRDSFGSCQTLSNDPARSCIVYDFPELDCQTWLRRMDQVPYDLLGYFLWIFGYNPPNKMHCFDSIIFCMQYFGHRPKLDVAERPTGTKIRDWLNTIVATDPTASVSLMSCSEAKRKYIYD